MKAKAKANDERVHPAITIEISKRLEIMAMTTGSMLSVPMESGEVYEELIGEGHVLEAFRAASKYMPRTSLHRETTVIIDGENVNVSLSLRSSEKYRCFLLPATALMVAPESKLGQLLLEQRTFLSQWAATAYLFSTFVEKLTPQVVTFLLPWLSSIAADLKVDALKADEDWAHYLLNNVTSHAARHDKAVVERQVETLITRKTPNHYPRIGGDLNDLCRAGLTLISQYRMLRSSGYIAPIRSIYVTKGVVPMKVISQGASAVSAFVYKY